VREQFINQLFRKFHVSFSRRVSQF